MKFATIRKPLFIFCLSSSLVFHAGLVWLLYSSPLSFSDTREKIIKASPSPKVIPMDDQELLTKKFERALEQSLNVVTLAHAHKDKVQENVTVNKPDEKEKKAIVTRDKEKKVCTSPPELRDEELDLIDNLDMEPAASLPPLFDPEMQATLSDFAREDEFEENPLPYESEKLASVDFSSHRLYSGSPTALPELVYKDDYSLPENAIDGSTLEENSALSSQIFRSLKKLPTTETISSLDRDEEEAFRQLPESHSPKLVLPNSVNYLRQQWIKKRLAKAELPDLDYYGLETIANCIAWEEDIDIDLSIIPDPSSEKYIFSLTLHPDLELDVEPMQQTFYFLIDRSSSIKKSKFSRFKRAVQRSMAALREGDKFNICVFDKKITMLSDRPVCVTPQVIRMAEDFLDRQQHKSFFAASDLYKSLPEILPKDFDKNRMHSIILITDGNTLLSSKKQRSAVVSWANQFKGNMQFYTAAAGKGNNLVLLDLLSYATKGRMLYSDTNAAFPRKLVRLVKDLHNPLIKNLTIEVTPEASHAKVDLSPYQKSFPPIFESKPYVIVGTVDEICDLTLFIQGQSHERTLNIRKKVSLENAHRGGRSLEKLWAHTRAKMCYESFMRFGKSAHLKKAQEIVAPYKGAIALEQ